MERPKLPKQSALSYIDSHAHIYSKAFDEDRAQVLERAAELGVYRLYMPNIDVPSIDQMLETELRYPQCVPMMGLHPCSVQKDFERQLYTMEDWLGRRSFAAIGEIGLDLYWDKSLFEQQKEAFRIQVGWAKQKGLPVVIHTREAMPQTLELLEELQDGQLQGVLHCFTGTLEEAQKALALGFYLGIGGVATFKNGGLDAVIPHIPLQKLVLETDSPYLAPVPHRGKRNSPEYIPIVARRVAELCKTSEADIAQASTAATLSLFQAHV
ncbi:TatD family hydrolase [Cesiribacter andamanensis]|uniref:Putative deoxyribonuclease YcfH n=1 Tax=Cesiribacter andamanensis AMV16 TaxID=1279009 RepID=M7N119_9BACT|nr:TatD family hydrolase [Cesiribacter andamanensis]EMR00906.1 putative deoxyribonuclease YcfH [Cesiribacter andamanensis AMV16]